MSLYTRARKHIDMDRVKELREEKIKKEEKIVEVLKLQENILVELKKIEKNDPKYCNWRREIEEGMTTSGMGMINLPANEFDVGPDDNKNADTSPTFGADGTLDPSSDYWMMNNAPDAGNAAITISLEIDLSRVDSIASQIYFTNATIDPSHGMDIIIEGPIGSGISPQIVPVSVPGSGSGSASPDFVINKNLRVKGATVSYSVIGNGGEEGAREIGTNAIQITSTIIYRRTPLNVFVSLDDPAASAFVRDTLSDESLSPEEKKRKIEEMLGASAEYLIQKFGYGIFTGATEISEVELQQSFVDMAQGLPYTDEDDAFDDDYYQGPPPDLDDDSDFDPDSFEYAGSGTEVAWEPGDPWPNKDKSPLDGPQGPDPNRPWVPQPKAKRKSKKQKTMVAHHEPQGRLIKEKKKEIEEGMNTSGMGMINLGPGGDIDLESINSSVSPTGSTDGYSQSGSTYTFGPQSGEVNGSSLVMDIDAKKYDTLKFDFTAGTIDTLEVTTTSGDYILSATSGTKTITLRDRDRRSGLGIAFYVQKGDGLQSVGTNVIRNLAFQRRTPMSVFVPLDDPESSSFVRDGDFDRLSNEQKKKKLEEMFRSSVEYLTKMFGEGMPKGATEIADYEPQQSFDDLATVQGPLPPGPRGYKKPGTYDPNKIFKLGPDSLPSPNIPPTGPGYSQKQGDTQVAWEPGDPWPNKDKSPLDGPQGPDPNRPWVPEAPKAKKGKKRKTMVAHHTPQGETIMEKNKKSFKDLTKKIPGYYDGKPAPLGFPIEEPPKMKNGFHPDLVDGKKVSNRYNRLDPQSAKAMPKTGNPHIDKKVRAAAKKPK